jgi:hypothetical protein
MVVPSVLDQESYDLAPAPVLPASPPRVPRPIAYRRPQTKDTPDVNAYIFDPLKDLKIPLALIAVGTVVYFGEVLFRLPFGARSVAHGFAILGIALVIEVGIMLTGLFLAAKLLGVGFGPFWIAVMKLCAILMGPNAAMSLIGLGLYPLGLLGSLLAWLGGFILYFALFGVLFDLDESDTWACVFLIMLLRLLLVFVLLPMAF